MSPVFCLLSLFTVPPYIFTVGGFNVIQIKGADLQVAAQFGINTVIKLYQCGSSVPFVGTRRGGYCVAREVQSFTGKGIENRRIGGVEAVAGNSNIAVEGLICLRLGHHRTDADNTLAELVHR